MSFYLYRFIDKKGNVIYIGRTNNIKRRILKEHFTDNTHLPNQCYLETEKIEYVEMVESEEVAYEAILINETRPKYNTQFKDEGCFQIQLPKFEWTEFQWEYEGQLEWLKKKKEQSVNINDVILNYLENINEPDIKTGIILVDSHMLLMQQSLTLVAGISGSSKTDFVLNIANYNAKRGKRVLFINLKEIVKNLTIRILSINSGISIKQLLLGYLEDENWNTLAKTIEAYENISLFFYKMCTDHWQLDKILSTIKESNADLVIIDDLQMIESQETVNNTYVRDKMDYILKRIKALAVQCQIPIIGTYCIPSQKINSRSDHRPMILDFEYDSLQRYPDNIQLLYRDVLYNDDTKDKNIVEIITAKNIFRQYDISQATYCNGMYANIDCEAYEII